MKMRNYIFAISSDNTPILINENALSDYILNAGDINMLNNLQGDSKTLVNTLSSELMAKTGPGMVNKQTMDSLYVRVDNTLGLKSSDLENFYTYIFKNFIGHEIVDASELIESYLFGTGTELEETKETENLND